MSAISKSGPERWLTGLGWFRKPFMVACIAMLLLPIYSGIAYITGQFFNLNILDPGKNQDDNVDLFDLYFLTNTTKRIGSLNDSIVIVHVEGAQHDTVLDAATLLLQHHPAALALDYKLGEDTDSADVRRLRDLMHAHDRLILAYQREHSGLLRAKVGTDRPDQWGYAEFEPTSYFSTIRLFQPRVDPKPGAPPGSLSEFSLAAQVVRAAQPRKWVDVMEHATEARVIIYDRTAQQVPPFPVYGYDYLVTLTPTERDERIQGMIVLMGDTALADGHDVHYTPLNPRVAGKRQADMSGVEIHARLINNVLRNSYLRPLGIGRTVLLSFLLCLPFAMIKVRMKERYKKRYIWAKTPLLLLASLLLFTMGLALFRADYTFSLVLLVLPVFLLGEAMDIFEAYCVPQLNSDHGHVRA